MMNSNTKTENVLQSERIKSILRYIVIVLTLVLIYFALRVAKENFYPGGNSHNTAYIIGGIGGLILIPVIILLLLKADAIAGIGYVLAATVIFSAALLLNHAEQEMWEPFSWMYVFQSIATLTIGIPAIWIAWINIVIPIIKKEPRQFEVINFLPFVLWLGFVISNEGEMWPSSVVGIIFILIFLVAFYGISIYMILRKRLHKGLIVLVFIPPTAVIMYVVLIFLKPREIQKNIHQITQ